MRLVLAVLLYLLSGLALAQSPANPPIGSVWTYTAAGPAWAMAPLSVIDNLTGPMSTDYGTMTVASKGGLTSGQIGQWVFFDPASSFTYTSNDTLRVVSNSTAGSGAGWPAAPTALQNGLGVYLVDENPGGSGAYPVSVGLLSLVIAATDAAKVWGINTVCTDNKGQGAISHAARYCFNEFDFNINSASTQVTGLSFAGNSFAQPALANGVIFFPLDSHGGTTARWNNAFLTTDGAAQTALHLGAAGPAGANVAGQITVFDYYNSAGTKQSLTLTANGGRLFLGGTGGYGFETAAGAGAGTNGMTLGATLASGSNIASQFMLWNWRDAAGAAQNYAMRADTFGQLAVTTTASSGVGTFAVNGLVKATTGFVSGAGAGVACSGTPTSSFATVGGIVTHC